MNYQFDWLQIWETVMILFCGERTPKVGHRFQPLTMLQLVRVWRAAGVCPSSFSIFWAHLTSFNPPPRIGPFWLFDIPWRSEFFLQVIHGLDELVYYYQHQPNSGLQHSLTHFVPGDDCPPSVKLHGVENLLHRASANGSLTVVSELFKCGGIFGVFKISSNKKFRNCIIESLIMQSNSNL